MVAWPRLVSDGFREVAMWMVILEVESMELASWVDVKDHYGSAKLLNSSELEFPLWIMVLMGFCGNSKKWCVNVLHAGLVYHEGSVVGKLNLEMDRGQSSHQMVGNGSTDLLHCPRVFTFTSLLQPLEATKIYTGGKAWMDPFESQRQPLKTRQLPRHPGDFLSILFFYDLGAFGWRFIPDTPPWQVAPGS